MRIFQKGFNYSQDGPGNRLVYHVQGCNMKCRWCCNPEGIGFNGGTELSVDSIVEECDRSRMMFFDGGGVTFTGGEATCSFNELKAALTALKNMNINTAIETNGTHPMLSELFAVIDFLMMDFKHYDSLKHKSYTGIGNEEIKKNFEKIIKSHRYALIRIPLINEFNNEPNGFGKYFSCFDTSNISFEVLPYHEYGRNKWVEEYKIKDGHVTKEQYKNFCNILKKYNLNVIGDYKYDL